MVAQLVQGAVNVGAEVLLIGDKLYAALCDNGRYNMWALDKFDAPVYYPDPSNGTCTCPIGVNCKHVRALPRPVRRKLDPRRGR